MNNEEIFYTNIIPKFLNNFVGISKRDFWQGYFDSINPEKSLDYFSEKSYLESKNITTEQIITNAIKYIYNNLHSDDYKILNTYFEKLISNEKIKVLREKKLSIYKEIIDVLSYVKQVKQLIKNYPLQSSEHMGTAHTSNYKSLVRTQINKLEDRLNHPYFPLKNKEEIEYTNYTLKILNYSLDEKCKNLPEYFNYINTSVGLDAEVLGSDKKELDYIKSFLNFYNGIKTTKIELVQSVAILINMTFKTSIIEDKEKAEAISNIIEMFFLDEITEYNKTKRTFTYNARDIQKNSRIKTVFHDVVIYAYNYSNSNNFMEELLMTGVSSILGINNMFEPDKPSEDTISNFTSLRSIVEFKKASGFTKVELKILESYF